MSTSSVTFSSRNIAAGNISLDVVKKSLQMATIEVAQKLATKSLERLSIVQQSQQDTITTEAVWQGLWDPKTHASVLMWRGAKEKQNQIASYGYYA